jgi:hypothetical protein
MEEQLLQPQVQETAQVEQPQEKMFRQNDVNDIVGRAKREAVESYKRQQAQQLQYGSQYSVSEEQIKKLASEEIQRQRDVWVQEQERQIQEKEVQRVISAYQNKLSEGKAKYEDFEQVTSDLEMQYYPSVVQMLADHVDNSADVMYDLARNRYKLGQLQNIYERNPKDAIYEIKKLSKSLKDNEEAMNARQAKAPLSQNKFSPTSSNGQASMRDLRAKYRN